MRGLFTRLLASALAVVSAGAFAATAETDDLFDEPEWPTVRRVWRTEEGVRELPVVGPYFRGRMITSPEDRGDGTSRDFVFRRTFRIRGPVRLAWIQAFADGVGEFKINDACVARVKNEFGPYRPLCGRMASEPVTKSLKIGENTLEIGLQSGARHRGGVLAELLLVYEDGTCERINTDEGFGDVVCLNPPPAAPWPVRLPYVDREKCVRCLSCASLPTDVTAGERVDVESEFAGPTPSGDFMVTIEMKKDKSLWWTEDVVVSAASNVVASGEGRWKLTVPFVTPLYFREGDFTLDVKTGAVFVRGDKSASCRLGLRRAVPCDRFSKPVTCEVRKAECSGSRIFVNGEPLPAVWSCVERQRRPDNKPIHGFDANLVTVMADSRTWNPAPDVYDFALLERMAESYRRENPNAYFLWDLMVCPPRGWDELHPEEMCRGENGEISRDGGRLNWSFASAAALEEVRKSMLKAVEWIETSPYANRVIGYRVNSGHSTEWLGWEPTRYQPGDFSTLAVRAFAAFAEENYPSLPDPHPPTWAEQADLDNGGDLIWSPKRHLNAIAFTHFLSHCIASDIISLAADVRKRTLGRKIICTYYGYTSNLNAGGRAKLRGHFALKEFLEKGKGVIDMVISPQGYGLRNFGDTCGDMKPFATLDAHGIVAGIENDTRTHNAAWNDLLRYYQAPTPWHSAQILSRDFSIALCRNQPIYYYSLCSGTDFPPEMTGRMAVLKRLETFRLARRVGGRRAEVAIVTSERAIWNLPALTRVVRLKGQAQVFSEEGDGVVRSDRRGVILTSDIFEKNLSICHRSGAPVDYLLAEDLKDNPGEYRLYVFANAFTWDEDLRTAMEGLRRRGAALLWLYAPGYGHGLENSLENMRALTGMTFSPEPSGSVASATMRDGRRMGLEETVSPLFCCLDADEVLGRYASGNAAVAVKKVGGSTSVFSGPWQMDGPFVRETFGRAGVHVWCESNDPIEASGDLVALHARYPGRKTIRLPRRSTVVDVFGERIVARDVTEFSFSAELHSSWLFYYGDEATCGALCRALQE